MSGNESANYVTFPELYTLDPGPGSEYLGCSLAAGASESS